MMSQRMESVIARPAEGTETKITEPRLPCHEAPTLQSGSGRPATDGGSERCEAAVWDVRSMTELPGHPLLDERSVWRRDLQPIEEESLSASRAASWVCEHFRLRTEHASPRLLTRNGSWRGGTDAVTGSLKRYSTLALRAALATRNSLRAVYQGGIYGLNRIFTLRAIYLSMSPENHSTLSKVATPAYHPRPCPLQRGSVHPPQTSAAPPPVLVPFRRC